MSRAASEVGLFLLGAPCVVVSGARIHMAYQKVTAMLFYLAVTDRPHSREALATLRRGQADDRRAHNSLRNALCVIRH